MGDDVMELGVEETEVERSYDTENEAAVMATSSVVSWERFLPKMAVRVLLVEADDSTRQIIAALLRKCSYRVTAVSDGLKAWEVLKGRSHNIDLILTEVELPSISGYALLTLIMEHHVCKNIPVIMMSSHDSVSMVYKCMLRSAADFLVKPLRKNELRNLWQHVWRKQLMRSSSGHENVAQREVEASSAENNTTSNDHTSGYRKCVEKQSDAQSSCTKPELESGGGDIEDSCFLLQSNNAKLMSNIHTKEEFIKESRETRSYDNRTSESGYVITLGEDKNSSGNVWEQANAIDRNSENNHMLENFSREAIDLIGAFDSCREGNFGSSAMNGSANKFDVLPVLDLSLRRSHLSGSVNQINDENQRLNHSDASAFCRYRNMPLQSSISRSPSTCNQQKEQENNSEKQQSNHIPPHYTSDTRAPTITSQKVVSVATIPSAHPEITFPSTQQTSISHPIPVKGARFVIDSNDFEMPSPCSARHSEPFPKFTSFYPLEHRSSISKKFHHRLSNAFDDTDDKRVRKSEYLGDHRGNNISFCYGKWPRNKSKIDSIPVLNGASECGNEEAFYVYGGMSRRSLQREAALTKFRLKRKERCFDKKVRYESRKKLAEQRPRVKGQFVRQLPIDTQPENSQ